MVTSITSSSTAGKPFLVYTPASLGAALRHYRIQAGLTQAQLAKMAGLTRQYVSALENGLETEQLRKLFALFRVLRLTVVLRQQNK